MVFYTFVILKQTHVIKIEKKSYKVLDNADILAVTKDVNVSFMYV